MCHKKKLIFNDRAKYIYKGELCSKFLFIGFMVALAYMPNASTVIKALHRVFRER